MKTSTSSYQLRHFIIHASMLFFGGLAVIPIYLMLINATRSTAQINSGISLLPGTSLSYNWHALTSRGFSIHQGFINSSILAVTTVILSVYFSAMTAYGLLIYKFKGKRLLWGVILIVMMLPATLSFIGFYRFMVNVHLTNSYIPLVIPSIASAATVLFLRQYLSSALSMELIDAARIDGSGEFRTFNRVVIPIFMPALSAQAIFAFVGSWNNFFSPFILLSNPKMYTLPMLVQLLRTVEFRSEYGGIYLGIAISIVPILVFYSILSRFIITGISMGGIKE